MNFNSPSTFTLEMLDIPIDNVTGNCILGNAIIGKQIAFIIIKDNTNEIADPANYVANIVSITGGDAVQRFWLKATFDSGVLLQNLSQINILNNGLGFVSDDIVITFNPLANYSQAKIYLR